VMEHGHYCTWFVVLMDHYMHIYLAMTVESTVLFMDIITCMARPRSRFSWWMISNSKAFFRTRETYINFR
jgi:hypothetical protein